MNLDINILIMAAGLGTRMRSNKAKVLHQLDGRPLVDHVVEVALALDPRSVCVIVGHQADEVKAAVAAEFTDDRVCFALQEKQIGTGDAINATRRLYEDQDSAVVVLTGDAPLITSETIRALIDHHKGEEAAATRNMANTAKVIAENPVLMRLKELETMKDIAEKIDELKLVMGTEGLKHLMPFANGTKET